MLGYDNLDEPFEALPAPAMIPPAATLVHSDGDHSLLLRLLHIADSYRAGNAPRQAITIYLELINNHANAPATRSARQSLTEIAEQYERSGELRQARSLFERLV